MKQTPRSLEVPYLTPVLETKLDLINKVWSDFFRGVRNAIDSYGYELSFDLQNNISTPQKINGLQFDKRKYSAAFVTYLIQRVTTGTGATELVESGIFKMHYLPTSNDWVISGAPSTAGITLTKDASGQIYYESSPISGDQILSRIVVRVEYLSAKSSLYSGAGQ